MVISVISLISVAFFGNQISLVASSGKPIWENDYNMELKNSDLILVGNSMQGM